MKVVLFEEALEDLRWWRHYYDRVFPSGQGTALLHLEEVIDLLLANPHAGETVEGTRLRKIPIRRTPFLLVYRVDGDELGIARIWDARQKPSPGFHEEQASIKS